ncbi:universal stress protein [filamentous cyanobacterium CCT1]|nr:universal stress protein [filamentous cyanobacterium CCT1]
MKTKILVALDRGETADALFGQTIPIAKALGGELMLLSVLTADGDSGLALPSSTGLGYYPLLDHETLWETYRRSFETYEAEGLQLLRRFQRTATEAGLQAEFTQASGSPGAMICNLARTWQADLIVVGSHGRKGFGEALLGSVSNYVMHHANCSVLVIKGLSISCPTPETEDLAAVHR